MSDRITRLAPSPTGALHLGNARTFLINYLLARTRSWRVLMRVEDLDGPRVKAAATEQMLDELSWLGLTWEETVVFQSERTAAYEEALGELIRAGAAYPCTCTRKDVATAATAPHRDNGITPYPGTCRGRFASADDATRATGRAAAWRVKTDAPPIEVRDEFAATARFDLADVCGDFVIFKNDGVASYQLAVTVDDAASGVNEIVRGDDLLDSAARQIHLRRMLSLGSQVRYWDVPLVVGKDGRRLAKRHGDTRVGFYRDRGVRQQRLLGLLGYWSGLLEGRCEATMDELADRFESDRIPRQTVVFTEADHEFLLGG